MAPFYIYWNIVIIICLFHISKSELLILNPNASTVTCGINDDCTIICNKTQSCYGTTFYFYNHSIHLQCTSDESCRQSKIYTLNTKSLNISATALFSFANAYLYSHYTDNDITVICGPSSQACRDSVFYYLNQGNTKHFCTGHRTCQAAFINAVSAVSLYCESTESCFRTSFILPRDRTAHEQSSITITNGGTPSDYTIKVLSLYPFTYFISTDGSTFDGIYLIFGVHFDEYCVVSDSLCMDSVETLIGDYDYNNITIIDTYIDGNSFETSYDGDVLIYASLMIPGDTFITPSISDTNTLYIICLLCQSITFNFSEIQNVVLLNGGIKLTSSSRFTLNLMHWAYGNRYFLNNTNTITFNSFGVNSEIYLGNAVDVDINCNFEDHLYYDCGQSMNIWSSLQKNEILLQKSMDGYWNIDTQTETILLHFDFEQYECICSYLNYQSNCSFLTLSPTGHPTNPTYIPTLIPSISTNDPSLNPSYYPSHVPSTYPSFYPSVNPSYFPSKYPLFNPSYDPTLAALPTFVVTVLYEKDPTVDATEPTFVSMIRDYDDPFPPLTVNVIVSVVSVSVTLLIIFMVCILVKLYHRLPQKDTRDIEVIIAVPNAKAIPGVVIESDDAVIVNDVLTNHRTSGVVSTSPNRNVIAHDDGDISNNHALNHRIYSVSDHLEIELRKRTNPLNEGGADIYVNDNVEQDTQSNDYGFIGEFDPVTKGEDLRANIINRTPRGDGVVDTGKIDEEESSSFSVNDKYESRTRKETLQ